MLFNKLKKLYKKKSRIIVGVISGTSVDRISVAVCKIEKKMDKKGSITTRGHETKNSKVTLLKFLSVPYKKQTRDLLLNPLDLKTRDISLLNVQVAIEFSNAIKKTLKHAKISINKVDLIGSHGQTIYHHSSSDDVLKTSLQLGDGDIIAEETGVTTICDFRMRDIAAGGEGAPLTPYTDYVLYNTSNKTVNLNKTITTTQKNHTRAILNLGGIANITFLSANKKDVIGFDCGPANAPLDRLARLLTKGKLQFDKDGKLAKAGKINSRFLDHLIKNDGYFDRVAPKSTGPEKYGDNFIKSAQKLNPNKTNKGLNNDLIAVLTEFCAIGVKVALKQFSNFSVAELIVAGGGAYNKYLIERIKANISPIKVIMSDEVGVPIEAREAMAFAILANDAIDGKETSLKNVTGAKAGRILGKVSY